MYLANLSLWDSIGPVGPTGKGNGSCILFVFEYSAAFFLVFFVFFAFLCELVHSFVNP